MTTKSRRIVRLHVLLREVSPPIWRRLEVRADSTFWALHVALQSVMGWSDSHLHDFELPAADLGEPVWIGMAGDGWRHGVLVEAIAPAATRVRYPRCLGGGRACPPEDVGGPHGYAELLAALADPGHEQHEELSAWIGKRLDPERFDPVRVHFPNPARRLRESYEVD